MTATGEVPGPRADAVTLVAALREARLTVATAESLTGGLLCGALTDVPGASAVVRGAVVAYATDVKASVLGVDAMLLERGGAVQGEVAVQLAQGVCRVLGTDIGLATTGVAGPDPQDGKAVGTVFVAAAHGDRVVLRPLVLHGDRARIRSDTVGAALECALEVLAGEEPARGTG